MGNRTCSIPGCDRPHFGRGWCNAHYSRWRDHGDPLAGASPRGASAGSPSRFLHDVILRHASDDCLIWPFSTYVNGYPQIRVGGEQRSLINLVCELAHGPAPTPDHEAAHSCGKGHEACVSPVHLSWKTPAANSADKFVHGTIPLGEDCSWSKLTLSDVERIRSLRGKMRQRDIGQMFGICQGTVSEIQLRKIWRHIDVAA